MVDMITNRNDGTKEQVTLKLNDDQPGKFFVLMYVFFCFKAKI